MAPDLIFEAAPKIVKGKLVLAAAAGPDYYGRQKEAAELELQSGWLRPELRGLRLGRDQELSRERVPTAGCRQD